MIFRRSQPLFLLACTALIFCTSLHRAAGQEQRFTDANCALTLPPDWEDLTPTKDKPESVLAAFGTHDQHHDLAIRIYGRGQSSDPMDQLFVAEVDRACRARSSTGRKVSGKITEVAGLGCYERRGTLTVNSKRVSTLVWAIPTGEGLYFLEAAVLDDEIENASDVRQAMSSFHFLHPPPPVSRKRSTTQMLRFYLVYYGIWALLIGLLIVAVLFIISFCLRLRRHASRAAYIPQKAPEGAPPAPAVRTGQPPAGTVRLLTRFFRKQTRS